MWFRLLVSAIFWVFVTNPVYPTTIIAIRTPDKLILGGDSMVTTGDSSEARLRCKTKTTNNVFWGESKIIEVPSRGFFVDDIAAAAMSEAGTLSDRISSFELAVSTPLTKIVNDLKRGDPVWFRDNQEDKTALEIVFAAFDNGISTIHLRYFTAISNQSDGTVSLKITKWDCPSDDCPAFGYTALGFHEVADAELSRMKIDQGSPDLPRTVYHLIQMEIAAVPEHVGPPIAIVEITKDGPRWVSEGQCGPQ
jgi:hypothetical protein